jgi:hypothetical protein
LLCIGGEDTRLSQQSKEEIEYLKTVFERVEYEALDVDLQGVEIMPMGFTEYYLRGHSSSVWRCSSKQAKKYDFLCSFGAYWPHLNEAIGDRREAMRFASQSSKTTKGPFPPGEYFEYIGSHRAMICPLGNGIQAPKIYEALIGRCVPIMTRSVASERLARRGLPIFIVDKWDDLHKIDIEEVWEHRQSSLEKYQSALLDQARFNKIFGYSHYF